MGGSPPPPGPFRCAPGPAPRAAATASPATKMPSRTTEEVAELKLMWEQLDPTVKQQLEAEWELVKFMGQEENTELREKLEILEEDIQDQQVGELWK